MAPNLKNFSQLTAPLAGFTVVRVKQAASYQPQTATTAPAVVDDSASYWEWTTKVEPAQLVSAEHIQASLVKAAAEQQHAKSSLDASNDAYWAEEIVVQDEPEHDDEPPAAVSQQEVVDSQDYWAETSYKNHDSDNYWNTSAMVEKTVSTATTATTPAAATILHNTSVNPSESAAYWQEEAHNDNKKKSMNDMYWCESRPAESADGDYWSWDHDVPTAHMLAVSDGYWTWNSMSSPSTLIAGVSV